MKTQKWLTVIILLGLLLAPFASVPSVAKAQATVYTCLPSCEANDGRMLTIAGSDLDTLVGIGVSLKIASPPTAANVEIGIFDGDATSTWDYGNETIIFTLYADPTARGARNVQLAQWSGASMPNNAWFTRVIANNAAARSQSGYYFYHLTGSVLNTTTVFMNNFKARSDGVLALMPRPFSYMASSFNAESIVYPNWPALTNTTYSGVFEFHTEVASSLAAFRLWDGDLDHGSYNLTTRDTDDADTPNNSIPSWSTSVARFEGVAVGFNGATGNPPDDVNYAPSLRSPSVTYTVRPLDGAGYANNNPSGNLEWERFNISSVATEAADYHVSGRLPSGLYHIRMTGMDMTNLNAWRFPWDIVGVCVPPDAGDPNPCKDMPGPNLIGDYVWLDADRDGQQDAGESPIAGVRVELFDGYGIPLLNNHNQPIFAITDANGWYNFDVEPRTVDEYTQEVVISGTYTVQVAATNFQSGGSLFGLQSTTGGQSLTRTVIDQNILTYDFGYAPPVPDPTPVPTKPGPYPYGYLRIHPEVWPSGPYTVGGVTYNNEEAIALLLTPAGRDMSYRLAWQMIATRVNIGLGFPYDCIEQELADGEAWLIEHPIGSAIAIDSPEWIEIRSVFMTLGDYNIGRMCAVRPPITR